MKKVLILFSGGKDSLLTTMLLLEQNFVVYLVSYENGCGLNSKASVSMAKRLVKKYGEDKVKILGVKNISSIWREFLIMYYNLLPSDILKKYGEVSISQFNCLSCRLAMYVASIILCHQYDIWYVADGARKEQLFVIEQEALLIRFCEFFKQYNIDILFQVKDLKDDFELKNALLIRGVIPKTYEPQCLLGMPMKKADLTEELILGCRNIFDHLLKDRAQELIDKYQNVEIVGEFF